MKLEYYGQIYKITNTTNNKVYIGQTTKKDLNRRICNFCRHTYVRKDAEKIGFDKFKVETILFVYDRFSLNYFEKYYISLYKGNSYNKDVGGLRGNHTNKPEQVKCVNCGKYYANTRRIRNKDSLHFCSKLCGIDYRKTHRKSTKIAVMCECCNKPIMRFRSELKKQKHFYCSKECQHKHYKILYSGKNNPNYNNHKVQGGNNGRAVKCKCLNDGRIFNCCRDADRFYNFRIGSVSAVCRGNQKSTHGMKFAFC